MSKRLDPGFVQDRRFQLLLMVTLFALYAANAGVFAIQAIFSNLKWGFVLVLLGFCVFLGKQSKDHRINIAATLCLGLWVIWVFAGPKISFINPGWVYRFFGFLVVLAAAFFLARYLTAAGVYHLAKTQLLIGRIILPVTALMYVFGINLWRGASTGRFAGWLDNPNTLGMLLISMLPVFLIRSLHGEKRWLAYDRLLLLILLGLVYVTGSRASLLAILVSGLVFYFGRRGVGVFRIWLLVAAAFTSILFWNQFWDQTGSLLRQQQGIFQRTGDVLGGRTDAWELAKQLQQQKPLVGYGYDSSQALIKRYIPVTSSHQGNNFHNSYLTVLVETGWIGGLCLSLFGLIMIASAVPKLSQRIVTEQGMYQVVLPWCIVASGLVHAGFESWLFSGGNMNTLLFWTAVFLLLNHQYKRAPNS